MPIDTRDVEYVEKLFGTNAGLAIAYFETGKRDAALDALVANAPQRATDWTLAFYSQDDAICGRMAELLASRHATLEDAFDWIIPITFSHGTMAGYVVQALARRAKVKTAAVARGQYMAAPAMIALLGLVKAHDERLLGRYVKQLRGPLSATKSEKAKILEFEPLAKTYAAELKAGAKQATAAAGRAAKAARAAVVAARPAGAAATADPGAAMPAYGRGNPASAHLVVGHQLHGWIKVASYEAMSAQVAAARKQLGVALVCVPGGALTAKGSKDGYLISSSVHIAVGLEVATARAKQPSGPIGPEAIAAAQRALAKRVPKELWARIHELAGDVKPYLKTLVMLLATGRKTVAVLEKGTAARREPVVELDNENSWGLTSIRLQELALAPTDELFLSLR
jgi:hypothetical protein